MIKKTLILLICLSFFIRSKADDGSYSIGPQGGTIYPINNNYIQMVKELVIYEQVDGIFTTTFIFTNTSDTIQKVIIGFPVLPSYDSDDDFENEYNKKSKQQQIDEIKKTLQFKTWIDNKIVPRELWAIDTTDNYRFAFITTVTFKPKETKKIVNIFKQGFGYGGDNMMRGWKNITYILKSGAGWKGAIKEAKIVFKMNNEEGIGYNSNIGITKQLSSGLDNYYYGYCLTRSKNGWTFSPEPTNIDYKNKIITWEFNNLEPDFDIILNETENDYDILCNFEFFEYLDTLSSYIVANDTLKFNSYYEKLKSKKEMFSVKKEYCNIFYNEYGKIFLENHLTEDFSKLTGKIRHLINAYAAISNYEFSNKMWLKTFQLFDWYKPDTKTPVYNSVQINRIDSLKLLEEGKFYIPIIVVDNNVYKKVPGNKKRDTDKNNVSQNNSKNKEESFYIFFYVAIILVIVLSIFYFISKKRKNSN